MATSCTQDAAYEVSWELTRYLETPASLDDARLHERLRKTARELEALASRFEGRAS